MTTPNPNMKQIDFFDIKKALPNLPSADLELVVIDAVHLLRREAFREAAKMIRLSTDTDVIEQLRKL